MITFETGSPRSRDEIVARLEALHAEEKAFLEKLSTAVFLSPQGEKWSPGDHVRHLAKSSRAVTRGLLMARPILFLLFGPHRGESRGFDEMREAYQARLKLGADAGRFAPSPHGDDGRPEEWRRHVMQGFIDAHVGLVRAAGAWREKALDRYRMPHPLLGKLSVREMLLFSLYHSAHHMRLMAERAAERGASLAPPYSSNPYSSS